MNMKFIVKNNKKKNSKINGFLKELLDNSYIVEIGEIISIAHGMTSFNLKYSLNTNEIESLISFNRFIKKNKFDLRIFRNVMESYYKDGEEHYYYKTECNSISYEDYKARLEYFCRY